MVLVRDCVAESMQTGDRAVYVRSQLNSVTAAHSVRFAFFFSVPLYSCVLLSHRIKQFSTGSVNATLLMNASSFAAIAIILR